MGAAKSPQPVKLISGFIYKEDSIFEKAKKALVKSLGPIELESPRLDFNYTDYYRDEMGSALSRKFVSFRNLCDPAKLYRAKLIGNNIEKKLSCKGRRRINIDPGYICPAKLVLATTKDFAHRIYLGRGIYAEITLNFHGISFAPHEWTYPDYRSEQYIAIFNKIRNDYAAELARSS